MSAAAVLGRFDDFAAGAATPASYQAGGRGVRLLLVRRGDALVAFQDVCPHQYLPLTYRSANVLSADGARLRCSSHGAEFSAADGAPLEGPTGGCALTAVPVEIGEDGVVRMAGPIET